MRKFFVLCFIFMSISLFASQVHPGDKIFINVWRNKDITNEYEVSSKGYIYVPLIGKLHVEGLDTDSLTSVIKSVLSKYINDPYVEVEILHKVTVLGQVYRPGVFYVNDNATVADLIAMSGGNRDNANLSWIYLKRAKGSCFVNIYSKKKLDSGDIVVVYRNIWPSWGEWGILISIISFGISLYNTYSN